jgi:23S rRNA (uracil1939-C5)-methyltransferase
LDALAEALPEVTGVCWYVNDRVADAAIGACRAVLRGEPFIEEVLGELRLRLSVESFFQTNSAGARILYDLVGEVVGSGNRLLDLYCGTGSIGLYLADRVQEVIGVELVESAVADARENAARAGISHARFIAGPVEQVAEGLEADVVVVDPPRAGLHPKAARWLAGLAGAQVLIYVACNPVSLARDREILEEGGWELTDVWTVDLFPQTGHMEAVARFVRR